MSDTLFYGVMLPLGAIVAGAAGLRMNPTFKWRRVLDLTIYRTRAATVTATAVLAVQVAFFINDRDFAARALTLHLASAACVALFAASAAGWFAQRRKIARDGEA